MRSTSTSFSVAVADAVIVVAVVAAVVMLAIPDTHATRFSPAAWVSDAKAVWTGRAFPRDF